MGDEYAYVHFLYVVFEVTNYVVMLCGCQGEGGGGRCPIWCQMADEVERGFYNATLLWSLFGQFNNLVVCNDVCVGYNFVDSDIVVGGF